VELASADLYGLRFVLEVWSATAVRTSDTLKSQLNRAVCREFAARGIAWAAAPPLPPPPAR
jgi:hypothetical protein